MSCIAEFSIFPMDKGVSVSPYVARALKIVAASGLPYQLGPMGTCIEGRWQDVMRVIDQCFTALTDDCERINLSVKVDYRKDRQNRLKHKIDAVLEKM